MQILLKLTNLKNRRIIKDRNQIEEKSYTCCITKASYTVEAALILPIIIFVILSLIYMAFYMHDKSRIQAVINSNVIKCGLIIKHEWDMDSDEIDYVNLDHRGIYFPLIGDTTEETEKVIKNINNQLSNHLYIAEIKDIIVDEKNSNITISVGVVMNISILRVKEFFTGSGTILAMTTNGRVHYPAEFVRKFDTAEGMIDNIKGYDKILEKLNKLSKLSK